MKIIDTIRNNFTLSFIGAALLSLFSGFVLGFSVNVFISPNGFVSTGFTGIGLLIGRIYDNITNSDVESVIAGVLYFVINIPIIIFGFKSLSKRYMILSLFTIASYSITMAVLPENLIDVLELRVGVNIGFLEAAVFAGAVSGTGNALAYIAGGSSGGIDVISTYLSVKKQSQIGKITFVLNAIILSMGYFITQPHDNAGPLALTLYTLVYIVINSVVIDLFYVRNRKRIIYVVSNRGDEISHAINQRFVRGVTELDCKGAYTGEHRDFLYCACSLFEVNGIVKQIKEIDPHAFISIIEANKVYGNFINKDIR